MHRVGKCVFAAGTALMAATGAAQAADMLLERDRYETSRPYVLERGREPSYEIREERFRQHYIEREEDVVVVPPRNIEGRRYGSADSYELDQRYAVEGPGWHRRVVAPPRWQDEEECRVFIKREVSPWGEVVVRRKVDCD